MRMTLPQIASFSKYMEERDKKFKSKSDDRAAGGKRILSAPDKESSIDALVMQFGSPEAKQALVRDRIAKMRERAKEKE